MTKKALITGIAGQDGSYLAEYLLSLGYDVFGIVRRNSVCEHQWSRLDHINTKITTFYGDLLDISSLEKVIKKVQPDENLQSCSPEPCAYKFSIFHNLQPKQTLWEY